LTLHVLQENKKTTQLELPPSFFGFAWFHMKVGFYFLLLFLLVLIKFSQIMSSFVMGVKYVFLWYLFVKASLFW